MTFRALTWRDGRPIDEAPADLHDLSGALADPLSLDHKSRRQQRIV